MDRHAGEGWTSWMIMNMLRWARATGAHSCEVAPISVVAHPPLSWLRKPSRPLEFPGWLSEEGEAAVTA